MIASRRAVSRVLGRHLWSATDAESDPATLLPSFHGRIIVLEALRQWESSGKLGTWWRCCAGEAEDTELTQEVAASLLVCWRTYVILHSSWPEIARSLSLSGIHTAADRAMLFTRLLENVTPSSPPAKVNNLVELLRLWCLPRLHLPWRQAIGCSLLHSAGRLILLRKPMAWTSTCGARHGHSSSVCSWRRASTVWSSRCAAAQQPRPSPRR